jgi:hypothetical protein
MTQRQHLTYRILCTVSENGNVLLIIPFSNLMFHIVWHSMTFISKTTLTDIPGQIRQNKNVQKLRPDSKRLRSQAARLFFRRVSHGAYILWIQYWSQHTVHVTPNYYYRGSANKVASIINEYQGESEELEYGS